VTGDLHDHGLGYSGTPQVSDRRPPEIAEQESGDTGRLTSRFTLVILSARPAGDLWMLRGGQEQNRQSV
jgi:hypothetical protein